MKQCFKRFINWFTQWTSKMGKEEKIGFAIGGIIGIMVAISSFIVLDKAPATTADYEPLEKQLISIQQNPHLLFKTDCNIYINDEVITVYLENDECKLTAHYDSNFEILSISKEDKYTFVLFALIFALFWGFITYCVASCASTVVIFLLEALWTSIFKKR